MDPVRLLTVVGVIAVHVVSSTSLAASVPAGAAIVALHVNREIFFLLTALVLTYSYGARPLRLGRFYARRYWLIVPPYLAWTAIYFAAHGGVRPPAAAALRGLAYDVATGTASYHLYFLLVTMQTYLAFPALRWLVRATRGRHLALLAVSLAIQLAFTAAAHARVPLPGPLGFWAAHPDPLLPSYQLYVIAGAVAADHLGELSALVRRSGRLVAAGVAAAFALGVASYLRDVLAGGLPPVDASQVFQPAVVVESLAAFVGLYALGVRWADGPRPRRLDRLVREGADRSFGVFLAHPLVLLGLLALGGVGVTGALPLLLRAPAGLALAAGLLLVVPLVLLATWVLVGLARRSPLSLPLTGRSARPSRLRLRAHPRLAALLALGLGAFAVAPASAAPVRAGARTSAARVPAPSPTPSASPPPPAAAAPGVATTHLLTSGGVQRSYEVIQPGAPVAAALPVVVFLHGVDASLDLEEQRDGLLPLVTSGRAILVYPAGYGESWNAGTCCGAAYQDGIDDVAFLTAVLQQAAATPGVDPARIYLVGYSNGGKMAYDLACKRPDLFAAVAVVDAVSVSPCTAGPPVSLLLVAGTADPEVPYGSAGGQVDAWLDRDGCAGGGTTQTAGLLTTQEWTACATGSVVEFATYQGATHVFPTGGGDTPSPADVIWSYLGATAPPPQTLSAS